MKRSLSIFILMSLTALLGTAQVKNVDVDNVNLTYGYRALPTQPQDPICFTYTTKASSVGVAKNYISLEELANSFGIEGQIKVENPEDALLTVELSLGNIVIKSSDVHERKEESKDKDGNVTKTTYYYKVVVQYNFEAVYRVVQNGKMIKTGSALPSSYASYYVFNSNEYSTRKAAADFWNNNKDSHVSNFYIKHAQEASVHLTNTLSDLYGFSSKKQYDIIKTIDTKKHDENTAFRAAATALKNEVQAMTADKPLNRNAVKPLIEYFKGILTKYTDSKSKADVRLRYAALWNLCKIYIYLDEPANVAQFADLIAPNGYDPKDGEKLKKEANALGATFEKTGIKTVHFNPDEYFAD